MDAEPEWSSTKNVKEPITHNYMRLDVDVKIYNLQVQ